MNITLSTYFHKGTEYFYSYPAGDDSNFFNNVDPEVEELVAARLLAVAGPDVKVVVFAATEELDEIQNIRADLGLPFSDRKNIVTLPSHITSSIRGQERNALVKQALKKYITPGTLVMAQPFLDPDLRHYYQIDPQLSTWLNDKKHMDQYIPSNYLAKRHRVYQTGHEFAQSTTDLPMPCVVKISSSSSGDGVFLCFTKADINRAKKSLGDRSGAVVVEEYVVAYKNFGIQFAIPHKAELPIEILGFNQQIISADGEFMGGMIDEPQNHLELVNIYALLLDEILPQIQLKGWYGVGGFDVLVASGGRIKFIDCNFRATGMTPYIFLVKNGLIRHNMISFAGTFSGSEYQFRQHILPLTEGFFGDQILTIVSIAKKGTTYRLNGAVQFDTFESMQRNAVLLCKAGIHSSVLEQISQSDALITPAHSPELVLGI